MTALQLFLDTLRAQLGRPYRWGGDDPLQGFDCSGLINEAAQSVGLLGRSEDRTAAAWFTHTRPITRPPRPGDLLFWMNDAGAVVHVEAVDTVLTNGTIITVGASGGTAATNTPAAAVTQNAYVKRRPARPHYIARALF